MIINSSLPFGFDSTLQNELVDRYLPKALAWLVEANNHFRSMANDNPWETAYCILSFMKAKDVLGGKAHYPIQYDKYIIDGVEFLLSKLEGDKQTLSIDNNPYDTGLALQAIVDFLVRYPETQAAIKITGDQLAVRIFNWEKQFLSHWLTDQTTGEIDDIAQTLVAILRFCEGNPIAIDDEKLISSIVKELVYMGADRENEGYWGSMYGSAYVILALQEYIRVFPKSEHSELLISGISYGVLSLEKRLMKSWDQPPDTAIALACYIRSAENQLINHNYLPEIIFLGFRWLCDKKQRYENGSIQRSVHYTVLFVNAMIEILLSKKLKGLIEGQINRVYDYLLGQMSLREIEDRSRITELRLENQRFKNEIVVLNEKADRLFISNAAIRINIVWVISFIAALVIGFLSGTIGVEGSEVTVVIPAVKNWELLFVIVSLMIPATLYITRQINKRS